MSKQIGIAEAHEVLWSFCKCGQKLSFPYDFLFLLCSNDETVIDRVVELWAHQSFKFLAISGGVAHGNDLLRTDFELSEAEYFFDLARKRGIPEDKIILEKQAKNTGENVALTRRLIESRGYSVKDGLMVQKPHMEKRCIATANVHWPEVSWSVTSRSTSFRDYCAEMGFDLVANVVTGDAWRLIHYPEKGYQTAVEYDHKILEALDVSISNGFNEHIPV